MGSKIVNSEKLKKVVQCIMHMTYDSPDEILKYIEKELKIKEPYSWEVRGNTAHLKIGDHIGVTIKLKTLYNIDGIYVQEYNESAIA